MISGLQCACMQVRKWIYIPRIWIVALFVVIFVRQSMIGIGTYCVSQHTAISPWIYPFIFATNYSIFIYFINYILLVADAPFMEEFQLFYLVRCGKHKWYSGQVIYIFLTSMSYFIFIYAVMLIILIPYMQWQTDWGKILTTLARMGTSTPGVMIVNREILESFTPLSAMAMSLGLNILVGIFLGLLIFNLNLVLRRGAGVVAAVGLVVLQFFIYYKLHNFGMLIKYFSPVSWVNLAYLNNTAEGIALWYPFVSLSILIIGLIIAGGQLIKICPFESQEEM